MAPPANMTADAGQVKVSDDFERAEFYISQLGTGVKKTKNENLIA